ncbi:CCCH zinc finger DNA binding protein [Aspergillus pseudoustus]|uniref:CCCH zinc finger DNA binding protein n=1 Tax=Aspergillus pseudoustus TaxID=1810923 RepID=A0ABR4IKU7_9EURO
MAVDIAALQQRRSWLCTMEDNKDKFIADLIDHVTRLMDSLATERDEVENQKRLVAAFKEDAKTARNEIDAFKRAQSKLNYVSVLVDGDGMNFLEELIRDGSNGGREAARRLSKSVEEHVQKVDPKIDPNTIYRIRVYANVEGLAKAYCEANTLRADQDLRAFVRGFNMERTLCDFVDAGNGKECADAKLQAHLAQDMADVHCRRVVFCASADNGYARPEFLGRHRGSDRITLVEGPRFANEMRQLADDFETTAFETVFMSKKLKAARKVSFGEMSTITPPSTPPTKNYASAARTTPVEPTAPITAPTNRTINPSLTVCVNAAGQRVDRPLKTSSNATINALKRKKLCNHHHILGKCPYSSCSHDHGPAISAQQRIDLISIARLCVCFSGGLWCGDPNCICGHRCPWDNCNVKECRFPKEMHGVDTKIVWETT